MPINDCRRVTFVFQFIIFYLNIIDIWNKKYFVSLSATSFYRWWLSYFLVFIEQRFRSIIKEFEIRHEND